jgi:hypothetical protein
VVLDGSFLIYDVKDQSAWKRCLRILRTAFFLLLVLYQLSYVAYFVVNKKGNHVDRSLVMLNWLIQAFISMVRFGFLGEVDLGKDEVGLLGIKNEEIFLILSGN